MADLILGPGAVLDVDKLLGEIATHNVTSSRLAIDPQAMVISPADKTSEKLLVRKIGSTGQGVGAARARKIMGRQPNKTKLAGNVPVLKPYIKDTREILEDAYCAGKKVFLEGTQGTGLSLHHGFYPYVTSGDTTASGCLSEAGIPPHRVRRIFMVCRTIPIRVENPPGGTSGSMVKEITDEKLSRKCGIPVEEIRRTELTTTTGKPRRFALFDWHLLRRSVSLNGPTDIALTFTDYIDIRNRKARRFEQLTPETLRFIQEVEEVASVPVSLISTRFDYRSIIDRRTWR